jgi:hypothetical protein
MPVFEITAPDGKKFRVTAPDGASRDDALARVQASYNKPSLAPMNVDPTEGMSGTDKFLAGAGKGMTDVVRGLGQVAGVVNRDDIDEVKKRDAPLMNTGAGTAGAIAGNMAATAPLALIPGAGTLAGASAIGAGQGLVSPVGTEDSRLANAGLGAAGGAAGVAVAKGLSRVAQPIAQSTEVKKLVSEGIVPTPGQAAGGNSFIGKVEQKLMSLPVVGDIIAKGRERSVTELNKAAINRSLPNGEKIAVVGRAAMQQADEIFDDAYRAALSGVKVKMGSGFDDALTKVKADPDIFLDEVAEKNLSRIVDGIKSQFKNGEVSGEAAKKIDSQLGNISRKFSSSAVASERDLGSAVRGIQAEFRGMLADGAGPEKAALLKELNSKYASFLRVQKASGYVGSKEGVFSANQLQSSVRAMDPSRNKRAFSQGEALMQDLSDPAKKLLGDTVPDSGTAGRAMLGLGLMGAGGGANEYFGGPAYLTALATAPLLYSRLGSKYMIGGYPAQSSIAEMIRGASPYAGGLGRSVLNQ